MLLSDFVSKGQCHDKIISLSTAIALFLWSNMIPVYAHTVSCVWWHLIYS